MMRRFAWFDCLRCADNRVPKWSFSGERETVARHIHVTRDGYHGITA
jgi:hypothetical protein